MEVKRELTVGELADRRAASLPVLAAVGGMVVPALVGLAVSWCAAAEGRAWAIPVATDIAFALGVLALAGTMPPSGVRVLLLAIAVIDDLLAITLIAILLHRGPRAAVAGRWPRGRCRLLAGVPASPRPRVAAVGARAGRICVHASGVHATVAGILLGLLTLVRPRGGEEHSPSERLEHRLHPFSAGVAVPIFALAATGIPLAAAGDALDDRVAIGVFAGLLVGKVAGIFGGARLAVRLRLGTLPENVTWADVLPVAMLGAIAYTVSLLISRLAFSDVAPQERAAAAVLIASVLASLIAVVLLRRRSRET